MNDNRNITPFKMDCTKTILCLKQIIIKPSPKGMNDQKMSESR